MKWPWSRHIEARVSAAEQMADSERAELPRVLAGLKRAREQQAKVDELAAKALSDVRLNGWTDTVKTIFGGGS